MVSVKHHYLPRYYLKGFTDEKDGFFVYDKKADKFFKSSSTAAFYGNNLNTVVLPKGDTSDFLEEMYTIVENQSWGSLDNIRVSTSKMSIQVSDKMSLYLFLLFLHWRLPSNLSHVEELSKVAFDKDNDTLNFFDIRNRSDGKRAPDEIIQIIKDASAFKKSVKVLIPFAPYFKDKNWDKYLENWRFLYSGDSKSWYIVGDNPIITEGQYDHDPIKCLQKFVFPVSGRILLVNTEPPIDRGLPAELTVKYGMAILERAQRFVACQNRDYLEALVEMYKFYVSYKKTDLIIPEYFRALKV